MSKVAPSQYNYCECGNRGFKSLMKKTVVRKFRAGQAIEIFNYVCPACGYTRAAVDTRNKKNVSQARYDAAVVAGS